MSKVIKKFAILASASLLAMSVQAANAKNYTVDKNGNLGSEYAGTITQFKSTYDDHNNTLDFTSTVKEKNHRLANGFWLVLNGGGEPNDASNPKGRENEIAILYGDHQTGRLTAYVYNGQNNPSSASTHGAYIQSFTTEFDTQYTNGGGSNDGMVKFNFKISLDTINDPTGKPAGWRGIEYGNEVGIWYHPFYAKNGAITYNADGSINNFSTKYSGWYDTSGTDTTMTCTPGSGEPGCGGGGTTTVSEPASLGLMGMGLIGLAMYRRKKA